MAEVIFKDIAVGETIEDFFSKEIKDADTLDAFSLNSHLTVCRIWINRSTNTIGFRNRGAIFNKLTEAIQSGRLVPAGVLIGFNTKNNIPCFNRGSICKLHNSARLVTDG